MKSILAVLALMVAYGVVPVSAGPATATAPAKLWVEDLAEFLNQHPGHWIVGHSNQPALSAAEAESLARRDAAEELIDTLQPRLSRPSDRRVLRDQIDHAMQHDGWIADRQVESRERPYATIWSAQVLVDASPAKVDPLVRQIERGMQRRHVRSVAGMFGGFILIAIVACIYQLLNWLTRGYFRARLALASLLLVSAGIFGIFGIVHLL
jgi:hypothetical protein